MTTGRICLKGVSEADINRIKIATLNGITGQVPPLGGKKAIDLSLHNNTEVEIVKGTYENGFVGVVLTCGNSTIVPTEKLFG